METDPPEALPVRAAVVAPWAPQLSAIVAAPWGTVESLPSEQRREWTGLFVQELRRVVADPCMLALARLFLCTKVLLAAPRHGGRARAEAASRAFRARLALWKAGDLEELWRTTSLNRTAPQRQKPFTMNLRQIARLIDGGQLSRAAARLCSRGVAEPTAAVAEKIEALFPPAPPFTCPPSGPAFETTLQDVRKAILTVPDGLAAGPSG